MRAYFRRKRRNTGDGELMPARAVIGLSAQRALRVMARAFLDDAVIIYIASIFLFTIAVYLTFLDLPFHFYSRRRRYFDYFL